MLLLQSLPAAPHLFPDHRDPARCYAVPDTLAPARAADGTPRFFLLRYGGDFAAQHGGLLQISATLDRSDLADLPARLPAGTTIVTPPAVQPRLRLVLRAAASDAIHAAGAWQPVADTGGDALTATLYLDAHDTQLLQALLQADDAPAAELLELELGFEVAGLQAGLPWSVSADGPTLRAQLGALLPPDAASAEAIRMAFRALPAALLTFTPHAGATGNPDDAALAEQLRDRAAQAALTAMFRRINDGYALHPAILPTSADTPFGWSLADPQPAALTHTLRWSISALHAALGDDPRFFPLVTAVAPLARATLHVVNALPIDPAAIAQVAVELRYRNRLGNPTHETITFDGADSVARRDVIFPGFGPGLALAYRLTCFIARPGDFPLIWPPQRDFVAVDGTLITIDRAVTHLRPLYLAAEPALLAQLAHITCTVTRADDSAATHHLALSTAQPAAWCVLTAIAPDVMLHVNAVAHAADGTTLTLHDAPLHNDQLMLFAWQLEPTASDVLAVQLSATAAACVVFAAVELLAQPAPPADAAAEGTLLALDGTQPRSWSIWRATRLTPPAYVWRLRYVRRNPDGSTHPLLQTAWQPATTLALTIDLPPP